MRAHELLEVPLSLPLFRLASGGGDWGDMLATAKGIVVGMDLGLMTGAGFIAWAFRNWGEDPKEVEARKEAQPQAAE